MAEVQKERVEAPETFLNVDEVTYDLPLQWWSEFDDATLVALIETALAENAQLNVAEANISIAQSILDRRRLDQSFSMSATTSFDNTATLEPDNDFESGVRAGLNAGWEYDAFGRIAATIQASELTVEAAKQARLDIAVIIASETALAYVDLRGAQARLNVARDNAEAQSKSLDLLRELLANGRATDLDVSRAEAQYRTTRAALPRFQAAIDGAQSRLAVLTGGVGSQPSDAITSLMTSKVGTIPQKSGPLMVGTPEDFLRRRPDIRQAEIEIARRLALSDVERARLFPRVSINANVFSLFNLNSQANQNSLGIGFGPAISWEGPDLRRVEADIAIADAETERAFAQYEVAVTQALTDVEIALSNSANELRRRDDLIKAVEAARKALGLAQLRFDEGLDDFLDVLDAQRTLLDAEDRLVENQLQTTRLTVLTYRELAGL